ncbi:MAG: YlmH/Sll1252 family protein [Eubacteriales bacterium]|nr:YlmH/Sll1252 family protein [Eubacteriales bacterium]
MDDLLLLENRIKELDKLCYQRDILKCTGFLSLEEQAVYNKLSKAGLMTAHDRRFLESGHEYGDRAVLFFLPDYMDRETAINEELALIKIEPVNSKFSDELNHRDYLGALMNLGIERSLIGDILTDGHSACIFCLRDIADFILSELFRVKHTSVSCSIAGLSECNIEQRFEDLNVNVASERLDAVISSVWNISRTVSASLIQKEAVLVDGRYVTQSGYSLKSGERVSVRGHGKFVYCGMDRSTKKGRLYVKVKKYI